MALTKVTFSMIDGAIACVRDFGAVGDGVADDTAAIQAAIDYVGSTLEGGGIYFPQGTYGVSSEIEIPYSNVFLLGAGGDAIHDGGTGAKPATIIKWISASISAGSIVRFFTPSDTGESKRSGGGISNMFIDCAKKVAGGINLLSYNKGTFSNITIYYPTYAGVVLSCYQAGTIADAADTQENIFTQVSVRCLDTASQNAHGFHLTSSDPNNPLSAAANSSFNSFMFCTTQVIDGHGFWMNDADNNTFTACRAIVVGSGYGLLLEGAADSNYFYDLSVGTINIDGVASGRPVNSVRNCFICVDTGNGTVYPTYDAGCRFYWLDSTGVETNTRSNKTVAADSVFLANSFYEKYPIASLVIPNGSQAHAFFCNPNDTNRWRVYVGDAYSGSDVDFSIDQLAGSGRIVLGAPVINNSDIYAPNMPTTAAGANVVVDNTSTPTNRFYRSTSSIKYKTDVKDLSPEYGDKILDLRPVLYRSLSSVDNQNWSWLGLIAEEVAAIEPRLVSWSYDETCYDYEDNGHKILKEGAELSPDGVYYDRISVLLIDIVKRQESRISALEKSIMENRS